MFVGLIVGLMIGSIVGVVVMSLMVMAKRWG